MSISVCLCKYVVLELERLAWEQLSSSLYVTQRSEEKNLSGQKDQKDSEQAALATAYFLTSVSVQRIAKAPAAFQLDFDNEQLSNYKILLYCTSCIVIIRLFL